MQLNWIVNTLYFLWTGNIMEWLYLPFHIFIFFTSLFNIDYVEEHDRNNE